jgi:PadR family transcriptional regulator, regulatory protein PadR
MLKGILEGCVLAIIARGETYGYDIIIKLEEYSFSDIQDGTLYPILTRLEKKNLIYCRTGKSPLGPKRKYYSITSEGEDYLAAFKVMYKDITDRANLILFGSLEAKINERD